MSTVTIEVYESSAWVDHSADAITYSCPDTLVERNTLSVTFTSPTWSPAQGSRIRLEHSEEGYLFTGNIFELTRTQLSKGIDWITSECSCVSREAVLSQRTTGTRAYQETLLGDIIKALVTDCLGGEGFTVTGVEDGPLIAEVAFDFLPLRDAFDQLCATASDDTTSYHWNITAEDVIQVFAQDSYPAPRSLSSDICTSISIHETGEKLANRVAIRLGKFVTAELVEILTGYGSPPQDIHYTTLPIASTPIVTYGSPAVEYTVGIEGIDSGKDVYWSLNSLALRFSAGLGVGATATVTYSGYETKVYGWVEDTDAIDDRAAIEGGTGRHEIVLEQSTPTTSGQATQMMEAYLAVFKTVPFSVEAVTKTDGFHPGQLTTVNIPEFDVYRVMLIESVTLTQVAPGIDPDWRIRAVEGALLGDWKQRMKDLFTGGHSITAGVVSGGAGGTGGGGGTTTPGPYPDAPNLTGASCSVFYETISGRLEFGFTGVMDLPTGHADYDHLVRVRVVAVGPGSDTKALNVAVHDHIDFTGTTLGYKSQLWPVDDLVGLWDVEFRAENEDGTITATPYTVTNKSVGPVTASSVVLTETGSRWLGPDQLTRFTARISFSLSSNPGSLSSTIWLSDDNGSTWQAEGLADRTGTSPTVDIEKLVLASTATWKAALVPRQSQLASPPGDAVISSGVSINGLQLPGSTAVTSLAVATVTDEVNALGIHTWRTAITGTMGSDPNAWHVVFRFRAEDASGTAAPSNQGGNWTPWLIGEGDGVNNNYESGKALYIPIANWEYNPIGSTYTYGRVEVAVARRLVAGVVDFVTQVWPDTNTYKSFSIGSHASNTLPLDQADPLSYGSAFTKRGSKFAAVLRDLAEGVINGSFEDGAIGWDFVGPVGLDANTPPSGINSLTATGTSGVGMYAATVDLYQCKPGEKYAIRMIARQSSASHPLRHQVVWYNGAGTAIAGNARDLATASYTSWTEAPVWEVTVPAGVSFARIFPMYWQVVAVANPFTSGYWSVDNVRVSRVQTAQDVLLGGVLGSDVSGYVVVNLAGPLYENISNNLDIKISGDYVIDGSGALSQSVIDLAKATNFDLTNFQLTAGKLLIKSIAVDSLIAGNALFAGTATFAYSGGGKLTLNSSGLTVANHNTTPTATIALDSTGITIQKGSTTATVTAASVVLIEGTNGGSLSLNATGLQVIRNGNSLSLGSTGLTLLDNTGAYLSMIAGVISLVKGSSSVTIAAGGVSIVQGIFAITSGSVVVNIDASNYVKVSNTGTGVLCQLTGSAVIVYHASGYQTDMTTAGFTYTSPGGNSFLQGTQMGLGGQTVVRTRYGTKPVTLADCIALFAYHGLCVP